MDNGLSNNAVYFTIFVICLLGLIFRIQDIHHYLNIDEITTTWVVNGRFRDIFAKCWINNLSPLYYLGVFISGECFGFTEASFRIVSIIPGVLSIPLFFLITFELSGSRLLSLLSALLSAVDSYLVYFSQEVRPYALIIFFSLLGIYLFIRYLKYENRLFYAALTGLISSITILFHYTAALICIVQVTIAIIYFSQNKILTKKRIMEFIVYSLIICISLMPFINHLFYLFSVRDILTNYESHHSQLTRFITIMLPPLTGYIVWPLLSSIIFEFRETVLPFRIQIRNGFKNYFLVLWYVIPLIVLAALAISDIAHMLIIRYLAIIIPVPIIAAMIIVASYKSRLAKGIFLVILVFITQLYHKDSVIRNFKPGSYDKHWEWGFYAAKSPFDWKEAVNAVNKSGIMPSKVYVVAILTEKQMLYKSTSYGSLLNDYLLSAVNSVYKLDDYYLKKAVLINSVNEIPDDGNDFIVIGRRSQLWFPDIQGLKKLSPDNATIDIYYKK